MNRITIFDNKRKSLILTTPPFSSIDTLVLWANTFIMGICPDLLLLITDEKNKDVGFLRPTPNGYVADRLERNIYGTKNLHIHTDRSEDTSDNS